MNARILAEPALVGREHEFEELQMLLNSTIAGKGTTVFVSGEAGAGKTRLITELLNKAKKQKVKVLIGWCLSNSAVPYFPFFEAFSNYFSREHEAEQIEVKTWLMGPPQAEKFGNPQIVTPQVWKDQTFTAVANTLASISNRHPVILFIDDLHWADSASLALIHYLANTVNSEKVLVIATFRSEQLAADVEGRPHPLTETLRLMRRQDLIKEINVSSLGEKDVSNLAKNMLGGNLDQTLLSKLAAESQGNPLFVVESLRMLDESHGLIQENDQWRLTSTAIGIPQKIKDIILQRLGVLVRYQRNILDVASVIGEKFDSALLANVLGQDLIETIKILDTISKDTSLVRCEGELYRFDHARTHDAIYDDISPALKKGYHGKVANILESTSEDGELPLSDLAYQFAQAGNKSKAVKYALAAGQDALAKWSNGEAIKHFTFVVQTIGENSQHSQEKTIALEGLGDAYYANNNLKQAIITYEQAAGIQSDAEKLRTLRKALHASFYQGDLAWYKALSTKAEKIVCADRLEAARILYLNGSIHAAQQNWPATYKMDEEALHVFEEEYALSDAANILLWVGFGAAMLGKLETGVAYALRSIALYDELGDYRSQMESYAYAGGTFQACALIEESNQMLAKAIEINEKYKIWDYIRLFPAYVWESVGLLGVDVAGSIAKALKALEYFEKTDSLLYAGAVHGVLIMGYALAGDTNKVNEYYDRFTRLPEDIKKNAPSQIYFSPMIGVYYAANNDFEKSNKCFTDWLAVSKSVFPNPFLEAISKQLFAWSLSKQGKLEEAKIQLKEAQKIIADIREKFSHVNINTSSISQTKLVANQTFPVRLDLVNVSRSQGLIVKVENLPAELKIVEISPNCVIHDGEINFKDNCLKPFEVKTVKLTLKLPELTEKESFTLNPLITYIDDLGVTKTSNPRALVITVKSSEPNSKTPMNGLSREPSKNRESDDEIDLLKRFGLSR